MQKILIIDDDKTVRFAVKAVMDVNGFQMAEASNARQGIEIFKKEAPDAVLLDLKMPDMDGIKALEELKKIEPNIPIIMLTAHGDVEAAVKAVKLGAYDFMLKPPDFERLVLVLNRAIEKAELENKVKRLNAAVEYSIESLLGSSDAIKAVIKQISRIAASDISIILQGDTGVGKSFIANQIHNLSRRADRDFVTVDIGTMPETLVESELFGYKKGAFTGAEKDKKGFFEAANGGTIFIDEVENIPLHIQAKLLRAIEEKKACPIGSTKSIDVDVRIIAATNKDMRQAVQEKRFRDDLFYRLGEFVISIPSLNERIEDIPFLANIFFRDAMLEMNKRMNGITDAAMRILMKYPWPGNIRELKNVMRKAVLFSEDDAIVPDNLQFLIEDKSEGNSPLAPLKEISSLAARDAETKAIKSALKQTNGNKTKAASILQIDYKTLLTKIKGFGI